MIIDVQSQHIKFVNDWVIYIYFEPVIAGVIAKARGIIIEELFQNYRK